MARSKTSYPHEIIGFAKYKQEIGLYLSDYESWVLDAKTMCEQRRTPLADITSRKDKRFTKDLLCPVRKADIAAWIEWFDKNATVAPEAFTKKFDRLDYLDLDGLYDANLPVVLYDFDELIAYENPDRNPYVPFDDYLPEGWKYVVVEGFDALVPDEFVYWSPFAARLDQRDESTL